MAVTKPESDCCGLSPVEKEAQSNNPTEQYDNVYITRGPKYAAINLSSGRCITTHASFRQDGVFRDDDQVAVSAGAEFVEEVIFVGR